MNDILLSLYVLIGIALAAGLIFYFTTRAAKRREEALAAFCEKNGYLLTVTKEPTAREIVVRGNDWRLVSSMRALQNASQSGSSDWQRETELVCESKNPLRRTFALQVSGGSADPEILPAGLRETAVSAMRSRMGGSAANLTSVRTAFRDNGRSGVIFETQPHAADLALEALRLPLSGWRGGMPLYIVCSPETIRLTLPDCAVKTADEIESLINIYDVLN